MSSNQYQIYLDQVQQLAETIVLKSTDTAAALNKYVNDYHRFPVDSLDPKTWKYYLNLAGEYHPVDTPMYVVSMDTLDKIIFSKENLKLHRATAKGYAYGTRQYRELVAQYPEQEMLILGILYPVDINAAIAAQDWTILGYPKQLVEANEYSLIPKLQTWINGVRSRWNNTQYGISDGLYPAAVLGILFLNMVPAILNLRLEACKTNEAHSFHVRQYLGSHGLLDGYMDHMTTKQALFFYRNIAFIERNVGKREVFEWLVEHIMTERYLPIAEYTMKHDLAKQPDEVYPTVMFKKTALNMEYSSDTTMEVTLARMLDKQDKTARDNLKYKEEVLPGIKHRMENSLANQVPTKILESSVVDMSNSSPYTLEEILINHWLFLSSVDLYNAIIAVTNPKTGERMPLTAKEAYTFLWYAFCKSIGVELNEIPAVFAKRVQRLPVQKTYASLSAAAADPGPVPGSVEDLMSVVDQNYISSELAEQALSLQPEIGTIISTAAFYDLGKQIYDAAQMQRNLVASQEHEFKRGMTHAMVSRIYSDNIVLLEEEGTSYQDWFAARNINAAELNADDMNVLYQDLVRQSTGMALNDNTSLKDLQSAMVKMLGQLSSYSVQFIAEINNTNIRKTDWTAVRVGDMDNKLKSRFYAPDTGAEVLNQTNTLSQRQEILINGSHVMGTYQTRFDVKANVSILPKPEMEPTAMVSYMRLNAVPVRTRLHTPLQPNSRGIIPVPGIDEYLQLSELDQQKMVDIYNNGYSTLPYEDIDPNAGEVDLSLYMMPRYVAPNYSF